MSTQAAFRTPPRAASPRSRDAARRPSSADQLRRLSDRLDALIRDVTAGARSQHDVERFCHEGEAIADGIRGVFRSVAAPEAVHPPLYLKGGHAEW